MIQKGFDLCLQWFTKLDTSERGIGIKKLLKKMRLHALAHRILYFFQVLRPNEEMKKACQFFKGGGGGC